MARRKQQWVCYCVWVGYKPGIYDTWAEVEKQWKGYPGGQQCGFKTREEAIAHMHGFGFRQDPDGTWSKAGVVKVDDADAGPQSLPGSLSSRPPLQPIQPLPRSLSPLSVKPVREDGLPVRAQPRKYWAIWSGQQIGVFHVAWSEMCHLVLGYKGCGFESYRNLGIAEQRMLTEGCTKLEDGSWQSPPTFADHQPSFVLYGQLAHDVVLGDANDDTSDTTLYYRVVQITQGVLMVKDVQVTVKETIEYFDYKTMQRALDALQRRSLTWAATIEALEDESTPWEREDIRPMVVLDYNPVHLDDYAPPQCNLDEVKRVLEGTDAFFDVEPSPVELYNGAQGVGRPRMPTRSTWEVLYVACSPEGGIGVFFGDGNTRNVSERYHDPTKAELVAVVRALEAVLDSTSRRILLQTEFRFNWKMLRPRFSALEDPLRTYLSRLFDSYLPRVRIRVQHVEDVYDCGMVREARAAARALAWYPDEEDEVKWDFDWEKKKRLLIDSEEGGEEEEAPGLEIYD